MALLAPALPVAPVAVPDDGPFGRAVRVAVAAVADAPVEVVAFVYCDGGGRVVGTHRVRSGSADMVAVRVRGIAIDALALDAAALVMAHNHPSGSAWPSRADREATRRIALALRALEVRLFDHVIVAGGARWSFRAAGLL
jgi:DNA repair protein RadC